MEILRQLNWVDLLAIIIIVRMSYVAYREGLTQEIFPLIGNIVVITIGLHFYIFLGGMISRNLFNLSPQITNFASFLGLTMAASFLFKLTGIILNKLFKMQCHPLIERVGGLIVGMVRSFMTVSLILMIIALTPLPYLQLSIRDKSLSGKYFLSIGPDIYSNISRFIPSAQIGAPLSRDKILNDLMEDKSVLPAVNKETNQDIPAYPQE